MRGGGPGPPRGVSQAWLVATRLFSSVSLSCGMSSVPSHHSSLEYNPQLTREEERHPPHLAVSWQGRELLPDVVEAGEKIVASEAEQLRGKKRHLTLFCAVWLLV